MQTRQSEGIDSLGFGNYKNVDITEKDGGLKTGDGKKGCVEEK